MKKTKYVIKNVKYSNYYQKNVNKISYHFVTDIVDAKKFKTFDDANKIINNMKRHEKYIVEEYKI